MQTLCPQGVDVLRAPLPGELKAVIASGAVDIEGCVFLRSLFRKAHVSRSNFPDATGYECFVNHLHMEDVVDTDMIAVGITFLEEISEGLLRDFGDRRFQGIITIDGVTCAVRFHTVRPGEQWLSDNLDEYKEEGVCVLDL
jgi:hypothetical protein